jgi:hypothetical protein
MPGHSETCEAVSETSGWSHDAGTKPCGLSLDMSFEFFCQTKYALNKVMIANNKKYLLVMIVL